MVFTITADVMVLPFEVSTDNEVVSMVLGVAREDDDIWLLVVELAEELVDEEIVASSVAVSVSVLASVFELEDELVAEADWVLELDSETEDESSELELTLSLVYTL